MALIVADGLKITTANSLVQLEELEQRWSDLFQSQPEAHLANSPAYIRAAATASRSGSGWQCWLAEDSQGPIAGLFGTVEKSKVLGVSVRVFKVGTEFVGDPLIAPRCDSPVLKEFLRSVIDGQSGPALVQFGRISQAGFNRLLRAAIQLGLRHSWSHAGIGYYWRTESGSEPVAARLSGHVRREIGRTERKMKADLGAHFDVVSTTDPELNAGLLSEFIELESSGWKGRQGTSIKLRPGSAHYFNSLVEYCGSAGWMRWYRLSRDGRAIAMNLGIKTHDTVWIPKTAYDEDFSRLRPGQALLHATLDHCISDSSVNRCDLIGSPEWLDPWRPSSETFYDIRVFCPTLLGFATHLGGITRRLMRSGSKKAQEEAADREKRFL